MRADGAKEHCHSLERPAETGIAGRDGVATAQHPGFHAPEPDVTSPAFTGNSGE
jgi:hypothetical protein